MCVREHLSGSSSSACSSPANTVSDSSAAVTRKILKSKNCSGIMVPNMIRDPRYKYIYINVNK